jgi:predicted nucleic acid-binding protein
VSALVVDNSLLLYVLLEGKSNDLLHRRLSAPRTLHAPHLVDYEFAHGIRGLLIGGKIPLELAEQARADFTDLQIQRYPGFTTAERVWELRHNFTAYDAAYIGLAELLDCPLLTGDKKLLGPHRARVEIVPA